MRHSHDEYLCSGKGVTQTPDAAFARCLKLRSTELWTFRCASADRLAERVAARSIRDGALADSLVPAPGYSVFI